MKPHESPQIRKKSIRGDLGNLWPVWKRGITRINPTYHTTEQYQKVCMARKYHNHIQQTSNGTKRERERERDRERERERERKRERDH